MQVDAKRYYDEQYEELTQEIKREKEAVKNTKRLGIGFVTFSTEGDART